MKVNKEQKIEAMKDWTENIQIDVLQLLQSIKYFERGTQKQDNSKMPEIEISISSIEENIKHIRNLKNDIIEILDKNKGV